MMERVVFSFFLLTVCCAAQKIANSEATAKTRVDEIQKSTDILIAKANQAIVCLLYTSPSPRDGLLSRMPSSA